MRNLMLWVCLVIDASCLPRSLQIHTWWPALAIDLWRANPAGCLYFSGSCDGSLPSTVGKTYWLEKDNDLLLHAASSVVVVFTDVYAIEAGHHKDAREYWVYEKRDCSSNPFNRQRCAPAATQLRLVFVTKATVTVCSWFVTLKQKKGFETGLVLWSMIMAWQGYGSFRMHACDCCCLRLMDWIGLNCCSWSVS